MMDSDAKSTAAAPLPSALPPMTDEERHRLKNEDVLKLYNTTQPDRQSCVKFADVLRLRLPSSSAARMTAARH